MTDSLLRQLVALAGTLVTALAYFSGYWSAGRGWWWTALWLVLIYVALYKFVNTGHH